MEKKQSAQQRLLKWLGHRPTEWVAKGEIERVVMDSSADYTADYIGRVLRAMHVEGKLKVKIVKQHAFYSISGEIDYKEINARAVAEF